MPDLKFTVPLREDFGNADYDIPKINEILDANKSKNFVQRILNPEKFPKLDLGGGNFATHKMAWASLGKDHIVYPNVVFDPQSQSLFELDPQQARQHALDAGEYIRFSDPDQADWFSKNYKKVWLKK